MSELVPQTPGLTPTPQPPAGPEATAPETPDLPPAAEPAAPHATTGPGTEPPAAPAPPPPSGGIYWGTGRRKSSVARVRLIPGSGKVQVNRRALEEYFTEIQDKNAVLAPLDASGRRGQWDVFVNVHGGGRTGQAGAIKLGVARALVTADQSVEPTLRDAGYLTRDARRVERKKYGHRKARRSFQFSKR